MLKIELGVHVTQECPTVWPHTIRGSFADPQFDTQATTDLFCYDQNTVTGAFFATLKNSQSDDWTPLLDEPRQVGGNHIFDRLWTHIVYIPIFAIVFPVPYIEKLLLFYDAASGTADVYETDGRGDLILKKQYNGWRTSWKYIIAGQFGMANLLFFDETNSVGEFCFINDSGNIQFIEGWS